MKSPFQLAMSFGHEALDKGDLEEARGRFNAAVQEAGKARNPEQRAESGQMLGVVYRLRNELVMAETELVNAMEAAQTNEVLHAKIKRNLGMVHIDAGKLEIASRCFDASFNTLSEALGKNHVETLASQGFSARANWLLGDTSKAKATFRYVAERIYNRHDTYELNNLIWLLRASVASRFRWGPRAMRLALRKRNKQRLVEAVILTFTGEHVYRFVKKLLKSRT